MVLDDFRSAPISDKMKGLLNIAGKVQKNGKLVTDKDVMEARQAGANDRDIHDTVLIAATFSLFNRYVDGLATVTPTDQDAYKEMGERLGTRGYNMPPTRN